MIQVTYLYSFPELSGKPKRFLESKPECKIRGYGVSTDTVTLSVWYEDTQAFNIINKSLQDRFGILPQDVKFV